jgi:putative peptidoglycan lipid II flippase
MLLNLLFVVPMVWMGINGPHAGLALATALAAFSNALLLFLRLRRDGVYQAQPGWGRFALQVLFANLVMLALLFWLNPPLADWLAWGAGQRASTLASLLGAAIFTYLAVLLAVGIRPSMLTGRAIMQRD